jgi:hypothetical protein
MTDRLIDAALRFAQTGLNTLIERITTLETDGWQPMTGGQAALFVRQARDLLFACDAIEDTLAGAHRRHSEDELLVAGLNDASAKLSQARERIAMLIAIMRVGRISSHTLTDLAA